VNATKLARFTVRSLIESGVSQYVLSPGSRSAPLSIALYEASQLGLIELFVRIDERSAAFFALGLSKSSDKYVAVVCTSGTALANYHPAALEAYHSDNKLLIVSADRPERLRRTGANQTTLHSGLLAPIPTIDTASEIELANHLTTGPVHLNLQFDEPLLADLPSGWLDGITQKSVTVNSLNREELSVAPKTLIIVGHDHAGIDIELVNEFIKSSYLPVIAEDPLSIPSAIAHASLFLSEPKLRSYLEPDHIIVIGRTTLSRSINALIAECPHLTVIDSRTASIDTARVADRILVSLPHISTSPDAEWVTAWRRCGETPVVLSEWSEQLAVQTIAELLPDESALFVASSRPIRDIEGFATPRSGLKCFANRGLAGIDGNISTAFGIAANVERSYAIIGDITFLHDISALSAPVEANLTIFLIDNNGGGIFNTLEQAKVEGFEKLFGTPHNLDLEKAIAGFGVSTQRVKGVSDLRRAINHPHTGLQVIVVEAPDRQVNAAGIKSATQSLVSALLTGANLA